MPVTIPLGGHGYDGGDETAEDERCARDHCADVLVVFDLVFTGLDVAVDVAVVTGPWVLEVAEVSACSLSAMMLRASYSARCASMVGLAVNGRTA